MGGARGTSELLGGHFGELSGVAPHPSLRDVWASCGDPNPNPSPSPNPNPNPNHNPKTNTNLNSRQASCGADQRVLVWRAGRATPLQEIAVGLGLGEG